MNLELAEKIFVVSGGAKGIGAAIVNALATEGALPVILGRNEADNQLLCAEVKAKGSKADYFTAELSDPDTCSKAVNEILKRYGEISGLINNAGVNDGIGLEHGNYEGFINSLHKNVIHYYLLAQQLLPALIKSKGTIVNIGSKTASTGQGGTSGYAAANGARNALTREWAVELLKYGIRVNAVIVAEAWTPLYQSWINSFDNPEQKLTDITSKIPLAKRMTAPAEIADMVLFLASQRSSHTTGQLIYVDGGYVHLDRAL